MNKVSRICSLALMLGMIALYGAQRRNESKTDPTPGSLQYCYNLYQANLKQCKDTYGANGTNPNNDLLEKCKNAAAFLYAKCKHEFGIEE